MTVTTTLRNAELPDIVEVLRKQREVRYDVVASSDRIGFHDGNLVVKDGTISMTDEGVGGADATLVPTSVFDGGIADRLDIPIRYLRRMRDQAAAEQARLSSEGSSRPNPYADLLDHNVNAWFGHDPGRKFLVRGFLGTGETEGIARAFLSDRYQSYDNLDIIVAALDGAKKTGANLDVISADLSERRMRIKVACPEIAAMAPTLLRGYRSPFDNETDPTRVAALERHGWLKPDDRPIVFAGFTIGNSETGNGLWTVTPELTVLACRNGLTIKADQFGKVHLGGKLDEGVVQWSDETRRRNIELIASQTKDAVARFISTEYVQAKVDEIEAKAGAAVEKPGEVLKVVAKQFKFSDDEADMILADFIAGGQSTAGGMLNAVTSVVQRIEDPDRAAEISDVAIDVLNFVAA